VTDAKRKAYGDPCEISGGGGTRGRSIWEKKTPEVQSQPTKFKGIREDGPET